MSATDDKRVPIFKRTQIIKLNRLLNMLYRPAEIAGLLEVSADTVYRSYLAAGAPYSRDAKGNTWIPGLAFRDWVLTFTGTKHEKHIMLETECWCMKCNAVTTILNPNKKSINRYILMVQGACSVCGGRVNRATSARSVKESV